MLSSFILNFFVDRFLPIDGGQSYNEKWFLRQLLALILFIPMFKLLNGRFITTWPIREESS